MIDYIRRHQDRFGVEPICPVLSEHGIQFTGSTYTAQAARGFEPADAASERRAVADVGMDGSDVVDAVEPVVGSVVIGAPEE